jgi:hypothetical protein
MFTSTTAATIAQAIQDLTNFSVRPPRRTNPNRVTQGGARYELVDGAWYLVALNVLGSWQFVIGTGATMAHGVAVATPAAQAVLAAALAA